MNDERRIVTDIQGVRYTLGRMLGRGGQGAVFEVEGAKLAVKLIFDPSPARRERLANQIAQVKRLPLENVAIARPRAVLRSPHVGYVMELLTGMTPLETLASPPRETTSIAQWYLDGGGLRRRLRVLAHTADALAELHGKGLVYGDPSPHNVFVSATAIDQEVRLIDADNLHYHSSPSASAIHTPGYGAPELISGHSGVNSLTDAHAFAVMAFRTLSLVHPLMGDQVVDGEPEFEEEALGGKRAYVDHPEDASNRTSRGIPRAIVLSKLLGELCRRTFVDGLRDPMKRPGIVEWAERLHTAADLTLPCAGCGATYYHNEPSCSFCDRPRGRFVATILHLWDPPSHGKDGDIAKRADKKHLIVGLALLTDDEPLVLTDRQARGVNGHTARSPRIEARLRGRRVVVRSLDDVEYDIGPDAFTTTRKVGQTPVEIDPSTPHWLHLGERSQLHRVIRFEWRQGGLA